MVNNTAQRKPAILGLKLGATNTWKTKLSYYLHTLSHMEDKG
jgi:hypothetical protein